MNRATENPNTEVCRAFYGGDDTAGRFYQFNSMLQLYSPEIIFKNGVSLNNGLELKIKGAFRNKYNAVWAKKFNSDGGLEDEVKGLNGIIPDYATQVVEIYKEPYAPLDYGIICHPGGSRAARVTHAKFYRAYGLVQITDSYANANLIEIYQNLVTDTTPDTNNYIFKYSKGIKIRTSTADFQKASASYTITPDASFLLDPYTITVTSDPEGNNALITQSVSSGVYTITVPTRTISFPAQTPAKTYDFGFYLKIKTPGNVLFRGTVDCYANIKNLSSVLKASEVSLGNVFAINDTAFIGSGYFVDANYFSFL